MSNYLLHGGTLALASFVMVNGITSAAIAAWVGRVTIRSGAGSAAFWFAARVCPASVALLFVAGVFVPSYLRYEPRDFVEGFDLTLSALALGATGLIVTAIARGARAWARTARRTRLLMQTARPLALSCTRMPSFEIDSETPMMALVGVLRPRLLITRGLLNALTDEELAASVAHEVGHSRAADNLKRLLMRAAPDFLTSTTVARTIERRWVSASEYSADRIAGNANPIARCALASALVKVARLMPPATPTVEPISTLVDGGEIVSRVQRLLTDAAPVRRAMSATAWAGVAVVAIGGATSYATLLRLVHSVTELLVHSLP